MPPRKASGGRAGSTRQQSTLSFNHRVTKNVPKSVKDAVAAPPAPAAAREEAEAEEAEVPNPEVEQPEPEAEQEEDAAAPQKTEAEARAGKVTDAQVRRYWGGVEAQRRAKRVHQEGLDLGEKVLRYFDVSSQYGPCIGVSRMRRWQRAERLGLNPPLEVLAVLLREEAKGNRGIEMAAIDDLMNATFAGAS